MKLYQKNRYENGKREVFILGIKCLTYFVEKFKKAQRCCDIPYGFLKHLYKDKNFKIIHPVGIVIAPQATIGHNCTVFQNTTIGCKNDKAPTLGNNVTIYGHSVIVGDVHIGNDAVIGAGSVVLHDIPAGEVWAGNPAHYIKNKNN